MFCVLLSYYVDNVWKVLKRVFHKTKDFGTLGLHSAVVLVPLKKQNQKNLCSLLRFLYAFTKAAVYRKECICLNTDEI